jgi:hypothetical protein
MRAIIADRLMLRSEHGGGDDLNYFWATSSRRSSPDPLPVNGNLSLFRPSAAWRYSALPSGRPPLPCCGKSVGAWMVVWHMRPSGAEGWGVRF